MTTNWRLNFHPAALAEAARNWYVERNPRAARALVTEHQSALRSIVDSPKDGYLFKEIPAVRFSPDFSLA